MSAIKFEGNVQVQEYTSGNIFSTTDHRIAAVLVPAIGSDEVGTGTLVWKKDHRSSIYIASFPDGRSDSIKTASSGVSNPRTDKGPAVALRDQLADRTLYIAYKEDGSPSIGITSNDLVSGLWTPAMSIRDVPGSSIDPWTSRSPTLVSYGPTLYLFYRGHTDSHLYLSTCTSPGTWSGNTTVKELSGGVADPITDKGPAAAAFQNLIYLAWKHEHTDSIFVTTFDPDSGAWTKDHSIHFLSGNSIDPKTIVEPWFVAGPDLLALFYTTEDHDLYLTLFDGERWSGNSKVYTSVARAPASAGGPAAYIDENSNVYLFYRGSIKPDLYVAWRDGLTGSQPEPT